MLPMTQPVAEQGAESEILATISASYNLIAAAPRLEPRSPLHRDIDCKHIVARYAMSDGMRLEIIANQ